MVNYLSDNNIGNFCNIFVFLCLIIIASIVFLFNFKKSCKP